MRGYKNSNKDFLEVMAVKCNDIQEYYKFSV